VQSKAAVARHAYRRRCWEHQKQQAGPISCHFENGQELPGQLFRLEGSPLDSLGLQHAIHKGRLKDPVWLQVDTSLASGWTFGQIDIALKKVEGEVLDLLRKKLQSGRTATFRRPDDSADELRAWKKIERLKYLDIEHIL
jgi:hypothetical protein